MFDKGEVPEGEYTIPLGVAEIKREGTDVTIVSFGKIIKEAYIAAIELEKEGISCAEEGRGWGEREETITGADDEHLLRLERVKNRFSQLDRNRADRDAAPLNLRPGSDELGHVKRLLKGLVEQRPGGLLGERQLGGLLELAKDFGLAQHH